MRHSDCTLDAGGPAFSRDNFGPHGRLLRLFKGGGGGGGDGGAAQMELSKKQHEDNMRQLRQQARVAANAAAPSFTPASAQAAGNADTIEAGVDAMRRGKRRFSFAKTQDKTSLGGGSLLGGRA